MFIEKELNKDGSPFQKNHIYILRGVVIARRNTLAGTTGTLDGREGGMIMRLADIEEDGTHIFHEMVYARDECQIALDGYDCEYAAESKELNISDFEDITDDADFTELLHSMKENEKVAAPLIKRTNIRSVLIEREIEIIASLLIFLIFIIGTYGFVYIYAYIKNDLNNLTSVHLMIYTTIIASLILNIVVVAASWISPPSLAERYSPPDSLFPLWSKIEKVVNKKDNAVLEIIYQKNDILLQTFEQKKHLERT